jgi:hypothetical protein
MRASLNPVIIAALISGIPFASIVRSYPTGGTSDIEVFSRRGISPKPVDPLHDSPSSSTGSDPFSDRFGDPFVGSPSASSAWESSADGDHSPNAGESSANGDHSPNAGESSADGDHSSNAGESSADGDLRLDAAQEDQRAKGEALLQSLDTAIRSNSGIDKKDKSMNDAGYKGQGTRPGVPPIGKHIQYLEKFQIDARGQFHGDYIQKPDTPTTETILETYEDPHQGALIVAQSWNKEWDPQGALPWTSMVMSNWRTAAAAETIDVKNLKRIVQNNIQSKKTTTSAGVDLNSVDAIRNAFNDLEPDKTKVLTLDLTAPDKTPKMVQHIQILSAQTHVARVIQMLQDYRIELGNLKIVKLHLMTAENSDTDYQWTIIIELDRELNH